VRANLVPIAMGEGVESLMRVRALVLAMLSIASCLGMTAPAVAQTPAAAARTPTAAQLKVFLDCEGCFRDYLESEVTFVDYVRDRTSAQIHVLITRAETGAGGGEYTFAFVGLPPFTGVDHTLKTITTSSDPEDIIRRQLATSLRVGLLGYVTRGGVPPQLDVSVGLGSERKRPAVTGDPWKNWVMSVRASASFEGEESSRERQIGLELGADRITPDWKITFGFEIDHEREEFDLDEDEPIEVERRERDFQALIVKGLGEHWSIGGTGEIESSTFDNTKLSMSLAPAIEYNLFPYSMYTRRQLRALYTAGVIRNEYYEETLFGRLDETRPAHELSVTYEQRERWGSLHAQTMWRQYLHDLGKSRLEAFGNVSVRVARGLSVEGSLNASRIRDQLSLPARGATPEEVLLRLRQLQSGYEYGFSVGLTYTFGSIFSSVVNPRFGQ
jgi:hypothetical protein